MIVLLFILSLLFTVFPVEQSLIEQVEELEAVGSLMQGNRADVVSRYNTWQKETLAAIIPRMREKIRVVSYNILNPSYNPHTPPQHDWPERGNRVLSWMQHCDADVFLLQEVSMQQLEDLQKVFGQTYKFFGGPHIYQDMVHESSVIMYRKTRFASIHSQSIPLEDPHSPGYERSLCSVTLEDQKSGQIFQVATAHFPYRSADARAFYAQRFLDMLQTPFATIVGGDFNTFANRPDLSLPFLDGGWIENLFVQKGFFRASQVSVMGHMGPIASYTNNALYQKVEPFEGLGTPGVILDPVFVRGPLCVLLHWIDPARVQGHFPSDHLPVIVDCVLERSGRGKVWEQRK